MERVHETENLDFKMIALEIFSCFKQYLLKLETRTSRKFCSHISLPYFLRNSSDTILCVD